MYHFNFILNVKNSQKRSFGVIAILVMLSTSPLSVSYSFADFGENDSELLKNKKLGVILTEKVVNGKVANSTIFST